MKRTIRALAVSAALIAALWPTSGTAHLVRRTDPAGDTPKIDIVKTSFDHANGNFILSFTTASPWTKADVFVSECGEIAFQAFRLDTVNDGSIDNGISIYVDKETNTFDANLYDYNFGQYLQKGDFGTITKTKRSLTIKFPKNSIDAYGKAPRWMAYSSSFSDDDPCDDESPKNSDEAPDSGWFKHTKA